MEKTETGQGFELPASLQALLPPMPIMVPGKPWVALPLPWAIIAPHAKQAQLNFTSERRPEGLTLEQLRARSLSAAEAVCILEDRAFEPIDEAKAFERLAQIVREHREALPDASDDDYEAKERDAREDM
jgi:hypothetical protein